MATIVGLIFGHYGHSKLRTSVTIWSARSATKLTCGSTEERSSVDLVHTARPISCVPRTPTDTRESFAILVQLAAAVAA